MGTGEAKRHARGTRAAPIGAVMSTAQVDHFIGGKRVNGAGAGGGAAEKRPVVNPATGETLAQVDMDSVRAAEAAVQAAAEAFPAWSATPVGDRCQFFF